VAQTRDVAGLMQRLGFEPLVAGDGEEALAQLHPGIELVLLDLSIPGMPGMELAERIRATPEVGDIPMILLRGREWPSRSSCARKHRLGIDRIAQT
jgi:two-component system, OmpR family, response regulator RegX3